MSGHRMTTRSSISANSRSERSSNGTRKQGAKDVSTPSNLPLWKKAALPGQSPLKRKRDIQSYPGDPSLAGEYDHAPLLLGTNPCPKRSKPKQPVEDDDGTVAGYPGSPPKKKREGQSPVKSKNEEKRLRVFRKKAPQSYLEKLSRATSQRQVVWTLSWQLTRR